MPTALRKDQHELMSEDGEVSLLFGTEDTSYLTTSYPTIELGDSANGDVQRIREDGIAFGEDFLGAKTYAFEIGVLTDRVPNPERAGGDALAVLESAWLHEKFRGRSASYAVLRSNVAGRTVRCYGRPRRYAETTGVLSRQGYTPVVSDFILADGRWYDDNEQQASATLRPATDGGLIAPLAAPLTTTGVAVVIEDMRVGGTKPTFPRIVFHGPVSNPRLNFGRFEVGLSTSLDDGQTATIDPRPWVRTVLRNDGANLAGFLTYFTPPMRRMNLPPGDYELTYRGTDLSATSWAEVYWRDAYARP